MKLFTRDGMAMLLPPSWLLLAFSLWESVAARVEVALPSQAPHQWSAAWQEGKEQPVRLLFEVALLLQHCHPFANLPPGGQLHALCLSA